MNWKNILTKIIAVIFLIWGLTAIANAILVGSPGEILWFCYIGLILIGLGTLFNKGELIASQILILAIPLIIWCVDAFSYLITGNFIWGFTSYFFEGTRGLLSEIVTTQHFFTIPLALFALWIIKFKNRYFVLISLIEVCLVFGLSRFLTKTSDNVNWVFNNASSYNLGIPYILTWFIIYFAIILITYLIIINLKIFKKP